MGALSFFFLVFILPLVVIGIIIWVVCGPYRSHRPTTYRDPKTGRSFYDTNYARSGNFNDFDSFYDKDKLGTSEFPKAIRDSAKKDFEDFKEINNFVTHHPLRDNDYTDKWIPPES